MEFLGLGWDSSHSCDLYCSCCKALSLTHSVGLGLNHHLLHLWCCREASDTVAPQWNSWLYVFVNTYMQRVFFFYENTLIFLMLCFPIDFPFTLSIFWTLFQISIWRSAFLSQKIVELLYFENDSGMCVYVCVLCAWVFVAMFIAFPFEMWGKLQGIFSLLYLSQKFKSIFKRKF